MFLYFFCFFFNIFVFLSQNFLTKLIINVSINNHIHLLLHEENIYIWDSSCKEDVKCLPSHQHSDKPALRKDIRDLPAITYSGVFSFSLQSCRPFFFVSCWRERSSNPNGNWSVDLRSLADKHLLWWVYTFQRIKKNSKELKRT